MANEYDTQCCTAAAYSPFICLSSTVRMLQALLKKFGVYILFGLLLCKLCACRHIVISVSAQYVRVIVCVDQLITCIEHKYWLLHIGLLQKTKQHRRSNSEHANRIRYMKPVGC